MERHVLSDFVREVNENIARLGDHFGLYQETLELICECGDSACTDRVTIVASDYERLREAGCRLVRPGHEHPARVREAAGGYVAVGV